MKTLLIDVGTEDDYGFISIRKVDDLINKADRFTGFEETLRICNRGLLKSILKEAFGTPLAQADDAEIYVISGSLFYEIIQVQISEYCEKLTKHSKY